MKTKTNKKSQTYKVGQAGSFFNQLMSNNSSVPVVGKGATELHYSDRTCYEVIEVSKDGKTVKLERLEAKHDPEKSGGMGHQNWILEPTGQFVTVQWRRNAWRTKSRKVVFTEEFKEKHSGVFALASILTDAEKEEIYAGGVFPSKVVSGITEEKFEYHKIRILFGQKNYYYDWEF